MTTYLTSDPHFFHKNIIRYSNRPYWTTDEMNQALIDNINNVVGPDDKLICLGDWVLWHDRPNDLERAKWARERINCKNIVLITGNHDPEIGHCPEFDSLFSLRLDEYEFFYKGSRIVCFHYPIEEWNECHKGAYHAHGHVHWSKNKNDTYQYRRCDVGVDAWDWKPISLDTFVEYLKGRKIKGHH